jgi:bacteriorhodopsin
MYRIRKLLPIGAVSLFVVMLLGVAGQAQEVVPLASEVRFLNFENLLIYTPAQHAIIANVLTLGYAAQAAGLVYFLATQNSIAPRYRLSSVLSAVVMASAFLELFQLFQNWNNAFVFTDGVWRLGNDAFSNGFRYMNWSIDVPMLLLQLVIVLGLTRGRAVSYGTQFIIGGLLMIYTGYIGQFYEVNDQIWLWIWGAISTVFYIYVLFVVWRMISQHAGNLPDTVEGMMRNIRWYILITWTLYPIAYIIPAIWPTAWGAVTRQIIFTIADISTKVIYGAILSYIARKRSEDLNYEPAASIAQR